MAKVKQLTVVLENQPGTLAHVAKVLADAKVNVLALLGSTAGAQGSAQGAAHWLLARSCWVDKDFRKLTQGP